MPVQLQKDSFDPQILALFIHFIVNLVGGGLNIFCNKNEGWERKSPLKGKA